MESMIKKNIAQRKFWNNKNVFLTGHTSFKGSWLKLWLEFLDANICWLLFKFTLTT